MINSANACVRWLAAQNLERAQQSALRVVADGQRAGDIITRIRALAKKAPPQKDWLDISQIIREVIALAQSEVQRNRIALETQLSDDVLLVFADRIQLQQVGYALKAGQLTYDCRYSTMHGMPVTGGRGFRSLKHWGITVSRLKWVPQQVMLNLMMNAMEAMTQVTGPRELFISSGADDAKGVVVVVQDSGAGLDAKSLERLFEPFYTTKPQGMGMGLAICRSIIEAHGGRLWATTNRDRGASFHFTLPGGEKLG
jgi:signal transduction histidine kinase